MAARLHWMPDSLQNSAISAIASSYKRHKNDIRVLPNNLLAEVLFKLYKQNMLSQLAIELADLDVILRLLLCKGNRVSLHQMFQGEMRMKDQAFVGSHRFVSTTELKITPNKKLW